VCGGEAASGPLAQAIESRAFGASTAIMKVA